MPAGFPQHLWYMTFSHLHFFASGSASCWSIHKPIWGEILQVFTLCPAVVTLKHTLVQVFVGSSLHVWWRFLGCFLLSNHCWEQPSQSHNFQRWRKGLEIGGTYASFCLAVLCDGKTLLGRLQIFLPIKVIYCERGVAPQWALHAERIGQLSRRPPHSLG